MITDPRLDKYLNPFKPFDLQPYELILTLDAPMGAYDPLHLDGILSKAIVDAATNGEGLAPSAEPYWLPLPLECAWTSDAGLPLWCVTEFQPLETDTVESGFWHKRAVRPELLSPIRGGKPPNLRTQQGPTKEYRIPLPVHSCLKWRATFKGDVQAVGKLLERVPSIGKKRSQGYGTVRNWQIQRIPEFDFGTRPVPIAYLSENNPTYPLTDAALMAWTPPYWLASTMMLCGVG